MNTLGIKKTMVRSLFNALSFKTNRKIIVFESDDWGSVRMGSTEQKKRIEKFGVNLNNDPYTKFDALEDEEDLSFLFNTLLQFRDSNNSFPIFTTNNIVANPNFGLIKESKYINYVYELFSDTYSSRKSNDNTLMVFKEGVTNKLVRPQLHGREHVNVFEWLRLLQNSDKELVYAFDQGVFSLPLSKYNQPYYLMDACNYKSIEELVFVKESLIEAVEIFERIWGYKPASFIGSCYIWSSEIEKTLSELGIKFLQGAYMQNSPSAKGKPFQKKYHFTGQKNQNNQVYLVRNAFFEPSLEIKRESALIKCLDEIQIAFMFNTPAIISTHRLNYIGSLDPENRSLNIKLLNTLLFLILRKYPSVEFLSSDQLGELIIHND